MKTIIKLNWVQASSYLVLDLPGIVHEYIFFIVVIRCWKLIGRRQIWIIIGATVIERSCVLVQAGVAALLWMLLRIQAHQSTWSLGHLRDTILVQLLWFFAIGHSWWWLWWPTIGISTAEMKEEFRMKWNI